jgi:hypothetical protein
MLMSAEQCWSYKRFSRTCRTQMSHFVVFISAARRLIGSSLYACWTHEQEHAV